MNFNQLTRTNGFPAAIFESFGLERNRKGNTRSK